ncbi:MAG: ABC transporter permease [Kiritimatiellae bacterium]|nr:ABC transporter permease [Kiritimatiellia bacterium]
MITREPNNLPETTSMPQALGRECLSLVAETGRCGVLLWQALLAARHALEPRMRHETVAQMYVGGIRSLPVITVVAVFTGMILALQTGLALSRYNQEIYVGSAVMLSMLREMGPFMTGLILAACVGSSMAAQLGTMTVNDEIAALEIMSIDPVRFLMTPRLLAMLVMTPVLGFYTCMMGVIGGGVVAMTQLNVSWSQYMVNAIDFALTKDLYVGMFKSLLFGAIIATMSCYEGFTTSQGAVGVGLATRRSVIGAFLLILIVGYFVTRIFYNN